MSRRLTHRRLYSTNHLGYVHTSLHTHTGFKQWRLIPWEVTQRGLSVNQTQDLPYRGEILDCWANHLWVKVLLSYYYYYCCWCFWITWVFPTTCGGETNLADIRSRLQVSCIGLLRERSNLGPLVYRSSSRPLVLLTFLLLPHFVF